VGRVHDADDPLARGIEVNVDLHLGRASSAALVLRPGQAASRQVFCYGRIGDDAPWPDALGQVPTAG